jgi:hypothetical protein
MKRAVRKIVILLITLLVLPIVAVPCESNGQNSAAVLPWVNQLRTSQGLAALEVDPLLERTAAAYAIDLARRGELAHMDEQGRRALQRYQAQGGTTVLVGEILGSGPDLLSVTTAWSASSSHSRVAGNSLWTHCGAAAVPYGQTEVWVLMFTSHRIEPLQILPTPEGYRVHGRLGSVQGQEPLLLSGIETVEPLHWDSLNREFTYLISRRRGELFHRLGYKTRSGVFVVTNTFYPVRIVTSDRGRERR